MSKLTYAVESFQQAQITNVYGVCAVLGLSALFMTGMFIMALLDYKGKL